MSHEKEVYLRQYYLLTEGILESLVHGKEEDLHSLLEQRDACIAAIDQLDQAAGDTIMNERIRKQLEQQLALEQVVKKELQLRMTRLTQQIRSLKKENHFLKQYDDSPAITSGVFYDTKR